MTNSNIAFISSMHEVARDEWQALVGSNNPFVSHDYLRCLEDTGATGPGTAWQATHLLQRDANGTLIAAVPMYIKDDSWGEFVFDFAWAEAHHRNGIPYYPKLVTAVPYTPVPGPRLLLANSLSAKQRNDIFLAIYQRATQLNASSWHILFAQQTSLQSLQDKGLLIRKDCQFHWFNRDFKSFDDYLSSFRSSRRKKTRRERRKVIESGVELSTSRGADMSTQQWQAFYELYASTFQKRGRAPYFSLEFFTLIANCKDIHIMVKWAHLRGQAIAASLFFCADNTLYGRYWGCTEFIDGLHFELCYYQGIEYCIEQGLNTFDPGVQGEHKIARGFQSAPSWSAHWIRHAPFAKAIGDYLVREQAQIDDYMEQVDQHLPFRQQENC